MANEEEQRQYGVDYGKIDAVHAGVDWISCSLPTTADGHWTWANVCNAVVMEIADNGERVGDKGLMGYRGIAAGGSFAGSREDGSYVQLAGHYAGKFLPRIIRGDLHFSRIDVAVTVQFQTMPSDLGRRLEAMAAEAVRSSIGQSRRRSICHMEGNDGGYTLYIGSPNSEQRARIYNKEVQSDDPNYNRCWRFEVVFKNVLAMEFAEQLSALPQSKVQNLCAIVVKQWLHLRGVPCPWFTDDAYNVLPITRANPTDAQRKLKWLEKQVKPTVRFLVENGFEDDVYSILNLRG
jgi:hypothetical protein